MTADIESTRIEWADNVYKLRNLGRWRMRLAIAAASALPVAIVCIVISQSDARNIIEKWAGLIFFIFFLFSLILSVFAHYRFNIFQENYQKKEQKYKLDFNDIDFMSLKLQHDKVRENELYEYMISVIVISIILLIFGILFVFGGARLALMSIDHAEQAPMGISPFLGALRLRWPVSVSIGLGVLAYAVLAAIATSSIRTRAKSFSEEIREKEYQIELSDKELSKYEKRAEKFFRINQYELGKYYAMNLKQNKRGWHRTLKELSCFYASKAFKTITLSDQSAA